MLRARADAASAYDIMRNALVGLVIAAGLAVSASGATVFGIDAWKIVLAATGAVIFVLGAERKPK
jgi:hypothetical protein